MATYYFYSTFSSDWNDQNSWWDQPGGAGNSGTIPTSLDDAVIETLCDTNVPTTLDFASLTIANGGTLTTTSTTVLNSGFSIVVANGGTLIVSVGGFYFDGTVTVQSGGFINATSNMVNSYSTASGNLQLEVGGILNVDNGSTTTLDTNALLAGTINVLNGSTISITAVSLNAPTINASNASSILIFSLVISAITINLTNSLVSFSASVLNSALTIPAGSTAVFTGSSISYNTITNNGTLTLNGFTGTTVTNNNACTIQATVEITTITNNATITTASGSLFKPHNCYNNGTLNIDANGYLALTYNSVLSNAGVFTHGSYTTRFNGRVSPVIPSSAAWGNALL